MNSRQQQRSGPGSQQIQVAGDLVMVGLTQERAIEMVREQARLAVQEFTAEAECVALERINSFGEKLVGDLAELGLLKAFADPAFQVLLRKAQLHAAATTEDSDHELLSKLLSERAAEPSKPMHMVVTRAAEVVEQIDTVALRGMLFLWFAPTVAPSAADPASGLAAIDSLISKLSEGEEFPVGTGWLQRLDLMNCINYSPPGLQSMYKWHDILLRTTPGYACEGISASDVDAIRIRLNRIIPNLGSIVVEHPFVPGSFRINGLSSTQLMKVLDPSLQLLTQARAQMPSAAMNQLAIDNPLQTLGMREDLQAVLTEARMDDINDEAKAKMLEYIDSQFPNLCRMRHWWDDLKGVVEITPVGTAIAYSNAKRFDQLTGLSTLSEMIGAS
jgi:hypothetical protein